MSHGHIFAYSWKIEEDDSNNSTKIRMYGLNEDNKNVCLHINQFNPYVYIELPLYIKWDRNKVKYIGDYIDGLLKPSVKRRYHLRYRKKLFYAHIDENNNRESFPYLLYLHTSKKKLKSLTWFFKKKVYIKDIGEIKLKVHESDASPLLQLTSIHDIPTAGWIQYKGAKEVQKHERVTGCDFEYTINWKYLKKPNEELSIAKPLTLSFDIEVNSSVPSRMPSAQKPKDKIFQISCILQRGDEPMKNYLLSLGQPDQVKTGKDVTIYSYKTEVDLLIGFTKFIQTFNPNVIVGYNILGFDFPYMIERVKGYSQWGSYSFWNIFAKMGFNLSDCAEEKEIKWSSSAYKNQTFKFLDAEGRLFVDLLPLIKRDYRMSNYKLKTVSEYFLGQTKDDLDAAGIFRCYREGMQKDEKGRFTQHAREQMAICGHYCVQDSVLVMKLFQKTKQWIGLCEMAKTCGVPIFFLYTQGQQIKVYSQIYRHCYKHKFVVEKDGYQSGENEHFMGATVFPPEPGVYDMVLPFDFKSLYPTIIIAYNIDYSTLVTDEKIPDSKCNVIEFSEHQGCEHDPNQIRKKELDDLIGRRMTDIKLLRKERDSTKLKKKKNKIKKKIAHMLESLKPYKEERADINKKKHKHILCNDKRRFRFLKEPKGVMPTVLENLLNARKFTRTQIKQLKKFLKDKKVTSEIKYLLGKDVSDAQVVQTLIDVLDKRQLSYKVSCNSMYGAMGVSRGYLPFMPGAMCTTAMGRKNIGIVADTITKKYKGHLVYGDTDSNYIRFPHLKGAKENWEYAEHVAKEVTKLFPPPIELEFEEEIYKRFFIITKKRYMYKKCKQDGIVEEKVGSKGVLLSRRDNCPFIKTLYSSIMMKIFNKIDMNDLLYYILSELNKLCSGYYKEDQFVITKAVNSIGNGQVVCCNCEMSIQRCRCESPNKGLLGDYKVPLLDKSDKKEYEKKMRLKDAITEKEYYTRCLPAQVQLAERMREHRGQRVDEGTRIEYVITMYGGHQGKQYEKIEHIDYFKRHKDVIKLDYLYYVNLIANPIDQLLNIMYSKQHPHVKDFVLHQYKFRSKYRSQMLESIQKKPTFVIVKEKS